MASPAIAGSVAALGFLDTGRTDERQAIYGRTEVADRIRIGWPRESRLHATRHCDFSSIVLVPRPRRV